MADIKKELNDIKNAVYGREVRSSIHDGIKKINDESEESKRKAEEAHEITQDLLDETFDSAALEANFEQRLDNEIANLQPEWTEFKNDVTSRLAQTEEDLFYNSVSATRYMKPCMTIVDDDVMKPVLTKLKPTAEKYNIPITLAVPTARVDVDSFTLTSQELRDLHETGLFEMVSHTHTHPHLTEKSDAEIEEELQTSKEWIKQNGYNHDVLVYPFGDTDERVKDIVAKYYKQAVMIDILRPSDGLNFPPVDSMELRRVYVENGVQRVKNQLDQIVNGGWVIVGTHCYNENFYPEDLEEIIDYAQSLGIDIVTMKEGARRYGNLFEAGKGGSLLTKGVVVGADGSTSGEAIGAVRYASEYIHADMPIYVIQPTNTIALRHYNISAANNNNMPEGPGLLESYRTSVGGVNQYSFQIYRVFENGNVYRRKWNHISNEWEEWEEYKSQYIKKIDMNVEPNTPYGLFPANAISYKMISSQDADGFPENRSGKLTTYRMYNDYYTFQTYEVSRSHNVYRRYWNPDTASWNSWKRLTYDARTLNQLNFGSYPKNIGDMAFATDLGKPVWWDGSKWVDANGNAV